MRRKFDSREAALLGALLVFVAGLCLQPMSESDLFFRLKVGQEILARGHLLDRNLFSFTAPEYADLDLAWIFEVCSALLYRAGGFSAVVIGKTIGISAVFVGLFAICRYRGAGPVTTAITLAGAALVMLPRLVERPHIVSFAGEAVALVAIVHLPHRWTGRGLVAFALAMIIWANAHAGVFAGAMMLMLAGVGALATDRAMARRGLVLGAAVLGAACVTPVGPLGIFRYLVLHVTLPRLHAIDEFRSATWRSDAPFFIWLLVFAIVVVVAEVLARRRVVEVDADARAASLAALPDLLPGLGMTVLALATIRFSADAALVTAPLLATRLSPLFRMAVGPGRARLWERAALPVTVVVLVVAAASPRLASARAGRPVLDLGIDASQLPLDALRFVEENHLRERMYNDFEMGSYLVFEGYPRYRVFVDPRLPAYPREMHQLLGSFDLDRAAWGAAMTSYGVESALLGYAGVNRRVAWWDPTDWALVFRASDSRVFVRRRERWRALIVAHEIPATFDFTVEEGTTTHPIDVKPALSPVSDCEWQRRLGDLVFELDGAVVSRARPHYEQALAVPGCLASHDEAKLAAWLGAVDLRDRAFDRAVRHLGRALELSPAETRTRVNRATALEGAGRRVEAAVDWARVALETRGTPLGDAAATRVRRLGANGL